MYSHIVLVLLASITWSLHIPEIPRNTVAIQKSSDGGYVGAPKGPRGPRALRQVRSREYLMMKMSNSAAS